MRNVDGFGIAADHLQACLFDDLLHLHGEIWLEVAEVDHFGHLFELLLNVFDDGFHPGVELQALVEAAVDENHRHEQVLGGDELVVFCDTLVVGTL